MITAAERPGNRAENLAWIAWLKVIAIHGVVSIHMTGATAVADDARETLRGQLAIWLDLGAIFAVPIFVMVSGALLLDPARYPGPETFLRKRDLRLLPAALFWHVWHFLLLRVHVGRDLTISDALALAASG